MKGAIMKRFTVKTITAGAMLVALGVIFSFLRIPLTNITEITLTGIPVAVGGFFFGPIVAAVIGALIDVLGFFVHPVGAFFPGFTISMAVTGVIYGGFLWRKWWTREDGQGILFKKNTGLLLRVVIAHFLKTVLISLILNVIWLSIFYGMPAEAVFAGTIVKEAINFTIEVALIFLIIRALYRLRI